MINGEELEQVKEFAHIGSTITEHASCHKEIQRRIVLGKDAFEKRKELGQLRGGINKELKKRMVKMLVWGLLYNRPYYSVM
jgi:hypothetical protein